MPELPQTEPKPKRMRTIAAGMLAKTVQRLRQLIDLGHAYVTYRPTDGEVPPGNYHEWRLASVSFLRAALGPDNHYCKFFEERIPESPYEDGPPPSQSMEQGLGVLRAVLGEIEFGPLPHIEGLISSEVFDDFLEMADHLLEKNYVAVVPSLVGAVLEDALRRIAKAHNVPVKLDNDSIASLNQRLADAGVYLNSVRKKIEFWNAVRNNADHGKFDLNSEQDVRAMLEGVREFVENYLS